MLNVNTNQPVIRSQYFNIILLLQALKASDAPSHNDVASANLFFSKAVTNGGIHNLEAIDIDVPGEQDFIGMFNQLVKLHKNQQRSLQEFSVQNKPCM